MQHHVVGHKAWPTWCGTGWLLGVEGRGPRKQRRGCGLERAGEGSGGEGERAKWNEGEVGRRGGGERKEKRNVNELCDCTQ